MPLIWGALKKILFYGFPQAGDAGGCRRPLAQDDRGPGRFHLHALAPRHIGGRQRLQPQGDHHRQRLQGSRQLKIKVPGFVIFFRRKLFKLNLNVVIADIDKSYIGQKYLLFCFMRFEIDISQ